MLISLVKRNKIKDWRGGGRGRKHKSLLRGYRLGTLFANETNLYSIFFLYPSRTIKVGLSPTSSSSFLFSSLFAPSCRPRSSHSMFLLFLFLPLHSLSVSFCWHFFFLNEDWLSDKSWNRDIFMLKYDIFQSCKNIIYIFSEYIIPIRLCFYTAKF